MARVAATSEVEAVYRRDGGRLWRALFVFAGDADVADEAMAEAFAQAQADMPCRVRRAYDRLGRGKRDPAEPRHTTLLNLPPATQVPSGATVEHHAPSG